MLNKFLKNERGLTLLELLAALVLIIVVSVFIFHFFNKGIENTNEIRIENSLRDEADIIVSKFVKELYRTKQTHIVRNSTNEGSYLEITNNLSKCPKKEDGTFNITSQCTATLYKVGFSTSAGMTSAVFKNEQYTVENPNIKVLPTSKIIGNPQDTSLYEILLELKITYKRGGQTKTKIMSFKNEIQSIVN